LRYRELERACGPDSRAGHCSTLYEVAKVIHSIGQVGARRPERSSVYLWWWVPSYRLLGELKNILARKARYNLPSFFSVTDEWLGNRSANHTHLVLMRRMRSVANWRHCGRICFQDEVHFSPEPIVFAHPVTQARPPDRPPPAWTGYSLFTALVNAQLHDCCDPFIISCSSASCKNVHYSSTPPFTLYYYY